MKKLAKLICLIICTAIAVVPFAGCRDQGGETVDYTKTQLRVGTFDGGFKTEWLNAAKVRFQEHYKDYEFEEGKKGVQIHITPSRSYGTAGFVDTIKGSKDEVFFVEQVDYRNMINKGVILDVTDAITAPLSEYGETESIEDKMYKEDVDFYGVGEGADKKYYGIPFYEATYGIQYDIDLFEQDNLYFAAEGVGDSKGFVKSISTKRGNGPDGIEGTYDDGLPATYEDFFKLCDKISSSGKVPIIWAGNVQHYISAFMMSLWADYEGLDQAMLNYTFDGEATNLVSNIDANGKVTTYSEKINNKNGYKLMEQAGRYYALDFMERIVDKKDVYYNENICFSGSQSHTGAQTSFLRSRFNNSQQDIAMLIDGTWWYNEAGRVFDEMSGTPGASAKERRIGLMPLPKADKDRLGAFTYYQCYMTEAVIKANTPANIIPVAKEFLKFCHTNESLSEFTTITSTTKPYKYTLEDKHLDSISHYGKSLHDLHSAANVVEPWSNNSLFLKGYDEFVDAGKRWNTKMGSSSYNTPSTALRSGISAKDYFNGLKDYWDLGRWNNTFAEFVS